MRDYRPADPLADVARSRRTRVSIELLGGFRVVLSSGGLPDSAWMQRRAARALIKLLAAEPDHKLHREQILDYVWPGMEGRSALNSFSKALHAARRALEHLVGHSVDPRPEDVHPRDGCRQAGEPRAAGHREEDVGGRVGQAVDFGPLRQAAGLAAKLQNPVDARVAVLGLDVGPAAVARDQL